MKYLKYFESHEEDLVEDKYTPFINWGLVRDLKDMALEYLAEGYSLLLIIHNTNDKILSIQFSHKKENLSWCECRLKDTISMSYQIELLPFCMDDETDYNLSKASELEKGSESAKNELRDRIKEEYPDEMVF